MAGTAEFVFCQMWSLLNICVNESPRLIFVRYHAICFRLGKDAFQFGISCRAVNGLQKITFYKGEAPAVLSIGVFESMTDNARDPFARCRVPVRISHKHRLTQV